MSRQDPATNLRMFPRLGTGMIVVSLALATGALTFRDARTLGHETSTPQVGHLAAHASLPPPIHAAHEVVEIDPVAPLAKSDAIAANPEPVQRVTRTPERPGPNIQLDPARLSTHLDLSLAKIADELDRKLPGPVASSRNLVRPVVRLGSPQGRGSPA